MERCLASEAALHGFRPLSFPAFTAIPALTAFSLQLSRATRCTADETKFLKAVKRRDYANQNHRFPCANINDFAISFALGGAAHCGPGGLVPGCLAGSLGGVRYRRMHWLTRLS